MAEIRVEPKRRSLAWLWVLIALALVALVFWYLNNDGVNQVDASPATTPPATTAPTSLAPAAAPTLLLTPTARVA
jgi:hypothetical protein